MPSGHFGILIPLRIYLIDDAHVQFAGVDLGAPVRVHPTPKIGEVSLPGEMRHFLPVAGRGSKLDAGGDDTAQSIGACLSSQAKREAGAHDSGFGRE